MSLRSWIRSLFTRPATRTIRKAPRRTRLTLEALEGRWCPSTITVLNIGDAPGALTYTGTDPSTGIANYTAPTLRAAIDGANAMAGPDTINFDTSGVFATAQTINLGGMQLELTDKTGATTNTGLGVTVNGGGLSRVFQVDSMVAASISGLTISGGMAAGASGNGGGLANFGNTTLSNCIISENSAGYLSGGVYGGAASTTTLNDCIVSGNSAVFGGGLDSHGTLTLQNHCTVSDNSATQHGGGLENYLGTTTLSDCVVSGNTSTYSGGGLFLNGGETTLTNCTISGNEASRGAGLAAVQETTSPSHYRGSSDNYIGTTTLTNCTVSGNKATGSFAGGVYNHNSNVTLQSCTISGNSAVDTPGFVSAGGGLLASGGQTTLTDCTVSGNISSRGAGLFAYGATVQLINSTISGNTATTGSGGGVYNASANVMLQNCTISGNSAVRFGGGLFNFGTTTLTGCTLSGNSAGISGGGVGTNGGASRATLTNCTLAGNCAPQGGGLWLSGASASAIASATLVNCTVSGNSATCGVGGGIGRSTSSTVTLGNTIVAGNTATGSGPDVYGGMVSQGYNLIGKTDGSSGWFSTDLKGTVAAPLNPLLAPLGYYGGLTQTMPLLPGSLAIDAGSNTRIPAGITTDQRGLTRTVNTTVDIGAFESSGFTITVVSGNAQSLAVNTNFLALVVKVTANNALEPVAGGLVTFTAPTSGASASFNGTTATISASGTASVTAKANGTVGSYTVTATARGLANIAIFSLTNKKKGT